jgi:hypothetical protein
MVHAKSFDPKGALLLPVLAVIHTKVVVMWFNGAGSGWRPVRLIIANTGIVAKS